MLHEDVINVWLSSKAVCVFQSFKCIHPHSLACRENRTKILIAFVGLIIQIKDLLSICEIIYALLSLLFFFVYYFLSFFLLSFDMFHISYEAGSRRISKAVSPQKMKFHHMHGESFIYSVMFMIFLKVSWFSCSFLAEFVTSPCIQFS